MFKQRSTTSWDGWTTSNGVEGRSSRSPTDVHAHGGTSKIHHEDVPAPVDSYRTHLTPLLWAGWSISSLDIKLKLIIFFSQPELPVTHFPLIFHIRRGVIHPPRSPSEPLSSRTQISFSLVAILLLLSWWAWSKKVLHPGPDLWCSSPCPF